MDLLFWHHDAAGFLALTSVAWALTVFAAIVAARIDEREAQSGALVALGAARASKHEPAGELAQPARAPLLVA